MALTPTTTSLCNSLEDKFYPLIRPAYDAKRAFQALLRDFTSDLAGRVWSPQATIDSALGDLQDQANAIFPGDDVAAMTNVKDFIDACDFLGVASPASSVLGTALGVFDNINTFINTINITVPEFGLGAIADTLNNMLAGAAFPGGNVIASLLREADKLLNCMSTLCPGYDLGTPLADLQGLFDDYSLFNSGPNYAKINYPSIYEEASLTASEITAMDSVIDGIGGVNISATTAIDNSVAAVKNLTKIGGFF